LEIHKKQPCTSADGFRSINGRGYFWEVLLVCKNLAGNTFARSAMPSEYEHTPSTDWDTSFRSLSVDARILLCLLAFFDPDSIPEWLLSNPKANITDPSSKFLSNEFW
jgi:hypothetical protein